MDISIFKKIGFSDKSATIYMALLQLGPSSVRSLAEFCHLNRGTTYDSLKWLQEQDLVNFYQKDTKQQFVAENPEKVLTVLHTRADDLRQVEKEIVRSLDELQALYNRGGDKPVARYFTKTDLREILEDVLDTCEKCGENLFRTYSAEGIREYLYNDFPTFSDARVGKGIGVRVISLGDGGELRGLDERKWLKTNAVKPTYIIIYPGKTAYISLDAKTEPVGVVIENEGVYETQKVIFDQLWTTL